MNNQTHIIYAGGTFGSHGTPLSPLPADEFLPILMAQLATKLPNSPINILENSLVKDSSALTPSDFVTLYGLILKAYTDGVRRFVLITGTDSLSFLAAFLANALDGLAGLSLVITGSMQPLFKPTNPAFVIDECSDAWANLSAAIAANHTGVFVQFHHKLMHAFDTQKINSQSHDAFVGKLASENVRYAQTAFNDGILTEKLENLNKLADKAKRTQITAVYCLPNETANLEHQLQNISDDTKAVILIGFGAGNVPSSQTLADILDDLHRRGIRVIGSTMCAFGGTNTDYAAGAWQYQHGVEMSALGIAGIYGQTLWQVLSHE